MLCITLASQDRFDHIRNSDLSVGIPFIAIVALSVAGSSWVGLMGLAPLLPDNTAAMAIARSAPVVSKSTTTEGGGLGRAGAPVCNF
jgi:hypothetical protein